MTRKSQNTEEKTMLLWDRSDSNAISASARKHAKDHGRLYTKSSKLDPFRPEYRQKLRSIYVVLPEQPVLAMEITLEILTRSVAIDDAAVSLGFMFCGKASDPGYLLANQSSMNGSRTSPAASGTGKNAFLSLYGAGRTYISGNGQWQNKPSDLDEVWGTDYGSIYIEGHSRLHCGLNEFKPAQSVICSSLNRASNGVCFDSCRCSFPSHRKFFLSDLRTQHLFYNSCWTGRIGSSEISLPDECCHGYVCSQRFVNYVGNLGVGECSLADWAIFAAKMQLGGTAGEAVASVNNVRKRSLLFSSHFCVLYGDPETPAWPGLNQISSHVRMDRNQLKCDTKSRKHQSNSISLHVPAKRGALTVHTERSAHSPELSYAEINHKNRRLIVPFHWANLPPNLWIHETKLERPDSRVLASIERLQSALRTLERFARNPCSESLRCKIIDLASILRPEISQGETKLGDSKTRLSLLGHLEAEVEMLILSTLVDEKKSTVGSLVDAMTPFLYEKKAEKKLCCPRCDRPVTVFGYESVSGLSQDLHGGWCDNCECMFEASADIEWTIRPKATADHAVLELKVYPSRGGIIAYHVEITGSLEPNTKLTERNAMTIDAEIKPIALKLKKGSSAEYKHAQIIASLSGGRILMCRVPLIC